MPQAGRLRYIPEAQKTIAIGDMICVSLLSKADQSTATHSISVLSVSSVVNPSALRSHSNPSWHGVCFTTFAVKPDPG
jgi:hypothetical protein